MYMPHSGTSNRSLTYVEAIREALDQAMAADSRVVLIGEGVPDPKAIFTTTAGLLEKYGSRRVFDMPISENGLTGVCIGATLCGIRPVMVHQRVDFSLLAADQIINNAAKWHYMFNGLANVPLVIRMIVGRGWGQGPQHSQSLQALFAMIPGLKVVMPTTAFDAKGMLLSAIDDNNPVIFIEHRWLHHVSDHVPEEAYRVPIGHARRLQEGGDVTVVACSHMALEALRAGQALAQQLDIHLDIVDLRSIRPLDIETVLASVEKTGRLIVADTAHQTGGIAGEIIAQVVETSFNKLKMPPVRICLPDFPTPTSPFMTDGYYPTAQTIADAALKQLNHSPNPIDYDNLCHALKHNTPHDVPNRTFQGPF
jgi:acetoin:2,6-dichlorophenolindophenol oxidoreductase subunit beta